jgi:phasin family protein
MMTAEQMMAAQKTNVEMLFGLTNKAFEGVEKLVELNMQVARAALSEASEHAKSALAAKDGQEFMAVQASVLQPAAEKAAAYNRHVYDILTATSGEVGKVAEANMADAQSKFTTMVDTVVKNAPAGTENVAALVKSAMAGANSAMERMQSAAKQAADVVDANVQALSSNMSKTAAQAAPAKVKRAA